MAKGETKVLGAASVARMLCAIITCVSIYIYSKREMR